MPAAMQPLKLIIPPTLNGGKRARNLDIQKLDFQPVVQWKGTVDRVVLAHTNHDGQSSTENDVTLKIT